MQDKLSPRRVTAYRRDGFVIIEDLLGAGELERWRSVVGTALAARGNARFDGGRDRRPDLGDDYYDNIFVQRVNLWKEHADLRELILDPRLGRLACELEGIEGVRVWHDQALVKEPWANPTALHLDCPYWSFHSRHATTIWVALDDVTLENGAMVFLPGTHRTARFDNVDIGVNVGSLFRVYPEWAAIEPRFATMRAGSCSFHNGLVAHGAAPNFTPRPRRAMTCAFMPVGSTFNGIRNVLTDEQVARLRVGDRLEDDRQNPLVFGR